MRARVTHRPHGYYYVKVGRKIVGTYSAPVNAIRHAERINRALMGT